MISFMDYNMDGKLELFIAEIGATGNLYGDILQYENGHYYLWDDFSFSGNEEKYNVVYMNDKKEYIFLQEYVGSVFGESLCSVSVYDVKTRTSTGLVNSTYSVIYNKIGMHIPLIRTWI